MSNACAAISQEMVAELAGIVFVLFGSHAYGLIQHLGAISRFEMTYVMMVNTSLAPALDDPQVPFVMEQPMVLLVVIKAFFEHFSRTTSFDSGFLGHHCRCTRRFAGFMKSVQT